MKRMLALFKCSYIKILGDDLLFMHTGCRARVWGWAAGGWLGWKYVVLDAVDIFGGCFLLCVCVLARLKQEVANLV